jgi:hypothetical protein
MSLQEQFTMTSEQILQGLRQIAATVKGIDQSQITAELARMNGISVETDDVTNIVTALTLSEFNQVKLVELKKLVDSVVAKYKPEYLDISIPDEHQRFLPPPTPAVGAHETLEEPELVPPVSRATSSTVPAGTTLEWNGEGELVEMGKTEDYHFIDTDEDGAISRSEGDRRGMRKQEADNQASVNPTEQPVQTDAVPVAFTALRGVVIPGRGDDGGAGATATNPETPASAPAEEGPDYLGYEEISVTQPRAPDGVVESTNQEQTMTLEEELKHFRNLYDTYCKEVARARLERKDRLGGLGFLWKSEEVEKAQEDAERSKEFAKTYWEHYAKALVKHKKSEKHGVFTVADAHAIGLELRNAKKQSEAIVRDTYLRENKGKSLWGRIGDTLGRARDSISESIKQSDAWHKLNEYEAFKRFSDTTSKWVENATLAGTAQFLLRYGVPLAYIALRYQSEVPIEDQVLPVVAKLGASLGISRLTSEGFKRLEQYFQGAHTDWLAKNQHLEINHDSLSDLDVIQHFDSREKNSENLRSVIKWSGAAVAGLAGALAGTVAGSLAASDFASSVVQSPQGIDTGVHTGSSAGSISSTPVPDMTAVPQVETAPTFIEGVKAKWKSAIEWLGRSADGVEGAPAQPMPAPDPAVSAPANPNMAPDGMTPEELTEWYNTDTPTDADAIPIDVSHETQTDQPDTAEQKVDWSFEELATEVPHPKLEGLDGAMYEIQNGDGFTDAFQRMLGPGGLSAGQTPNWFADRFSPPLGPDGYHYDMNADRLSVFAHRMGLINDVGESIVMEPNDTIGFDSQGRLVIERYVSPLETRKIAITDLTGNPLGGLAKYFQFKKY